MIYLLYEQKANIINSLLFDFYKRYPKPCHVNVLSDRQASGLVGQMQTAPLISDGWLVLCSAAVSPEWLSKLDAKSSNNSVVVRIFGRSELNNHAHMLVGRDFRVIDNYKIDKSTLYEWVMNELGCDYDTAKYLCNRVNCQTSSLVRNVNLLKMLPFVGRGEIQRYVEKESKYSVSDLSSFLIGYDDLRGFTYRNAVEMLYRFRYSYSWLIKKLLADVELHLKIFGLLGSGELSLTNYQRFRRNSGDKDVRGLTDKSLFRIISQYGEVSTEYLLHLKSILSLMSGKPSEICKLATLFATV